MNRLNILAVVLLVSFVPGCQPAPKQYTELESHILDAADSQSILVQVDHGEVIVLESEDDHVEVGGQVLFAEEVDYQVSSTEKQILIKAHVNRNRSPGYTSSSGSARPERDAGES